MVRGPTRTFASMYLQEAKRSGEGFGLGRKAGSVVASATPAAKPLRLSVCRPSWQWDETASPPQDSEIVLSKGSGHELLRPCNR